MPPIFRASYIYISVLCGAVVFMAVLDHSIIRGHVAWLVYVDLAVVFIKVTELKKGKGEVGIFVGQTTRSLSRQTLAQTLNFGLPMQRAARFTRTPVSSRSLCTTPTNTAFGGNMQ